jgi:hypothetical protein
LVSAATYGLLSFPISDKSVCHSNLIFDINPNSLSHQSLIESRRGGSQFHSVTLNGAL